MWELIVAAIIALPLLFYYHWTSVYDYWRKRDVPYVKGKFPWGNLKDLVLLSRFQGKVLQERYDEAAPKPLIGLYFMRTPQVLLRDPEMIKLVMTKEFSHFRNRVEDSDAAREPLSDHLFNLREDKWRATRLKLAPTFTSGKLKAMFPLFKECSERFTRRLDKEAASSVSSDLKTLLSQFTLETIASCTFGVELGSFDDSRENRLLTFGRLMFTAKPRLTVLLRNVLYSSWSWLHKLFHIRHINKPLTEELYSLVSATMEYRENNNVTRNDFLNLLMEMKRKGKIEYESSNVKEEDEEYKELSKSSKSEDKHIDVDLDFMVAQTTVFLLAGLETSSSVATYCLYELALHQDLQDRLRGEIDAAVARHGGLTYQAVQEMTYLDQCVSETIRKYPTLPYLTRYCTKNIKLPGTNFVMERGVRCLIPTYALQHDPKYFPEPDKYDPDRFSPERKSSIVPYTYLPFGEGPRICIGMRFGQMQTKMAICTVISQYELYPTKETQKTLKFAGTLIVAVVEGDIIVQIKHRTTKPKL